MATSSTSSNNAPRISIFRAKPGFVIPKNKLSGSLVPALCGAKKSLGSEAAPEESTKQSQKKTKWAPDLTQDASVRKGRATAYQTRVNQITETLKSGTLWSGDDRASTSASNVDNNSSSKQIKDEKIKDLELEKLEAIGEILRLNPSYKPPPDFSPLMRETSVPLPVRKHPGCNFVSLVLGPGSSTQNRLEKETGSRIRVFGYKLETGKKVEVKALDGDDVSNSFEKLYVQICADSYEKVDAAVSLIELLIASVSSKPAVTAAATVSGDDSLLVGKSEGVITSPVTTEALRSTGLPVMGSMMAPPVNSQLSTTPVRWVPAGLPQTPTSMPTVSMPGQIPSFPFCSSDMHSLRPRPVSVTPYGLVPRTPIFALPQQQVQYAQNTFAPSARPLGHSNPPSPLVSAPPPFAGHQASLASPGGVRGQLNPTGWTGNPNPPHGPLVSVSPLPVPPAGPSTAPSTSLPPRPTHGPPSLLAQQNQPSPSPSMLVQQYGQAQPIVSPRGPPAAHPSQAGLPTPRLTTIPGPSFTPLRPMGGGSGPNQMISGDFTFQPSRPCLSPSQPPLMLNNQSSLQPPSFRPVTQAPQVGPQNLMRPPMNNQMGHFMPPNMNAYMGVRNHGQFVPPPGAGSTFQQRPENVAHLQQSRPGGPLTIPGNMLSPNQGPRFGGSLPGGGGKPANVQQSYDPFLPSSVFAVRPQNQGGNLENAKKQEDDPEYEDLMASVGVK